MSTEPLHARPQRRPDVPFRDVVALAVVASLTLGLVAQGCEAQRTARAAIARCGR